METGSRMGSNDGLYDAYAGCAPSVAAEWESRSTGEDGVRAGRRGAGETPIGRSTTGELFRSWAARARSANVRGM